MRRERSRARPTSADWTSGYGLMRHAEALLPDDHRDADLVASEIVQALMHQWRTALGINVSSQSIEGKVFKERVSKKDYAIATVAWYGDYPDASTFTDKYLSTSLQNDSDWQNKEFDDLVKQGNAAESNEQALELYQQAEDVLLEDMPIAPMFFGVEQWVHSEKVSNVQQDAFGHIRLAEVTVNS